MILFFLKFIVSQQIFNITFDSIRSLELYFSPRDTIELEVSGKLQTYFSDMNKANGISLEIETNDSSMFGPYTFLSHLDGIYFREQ